MFAFTERQSEIGNRKSEMVSQWVVDKDFRVLDLA